MDNVDASVQECRDPAIQCATISNVRRRIQNILGSAKTDPSMAGALPPGAWWEYGSEGTLPPDPEPYGNNAGDDALGPHLP